MTDFNFYVPISKVEKQKDGSVIVEGYATTETLDLDGEIVSIDAVKKALPSYWEYRNIREMHQPSAVGRAQNYNLDDIGCFLRSKISDPVAAQKCIDKVYNGYSIGGRKLAKNGNTITDLELIEISIVDRPANPDCRMVVAKRAKNDKEGAHLLKARKVLLNPKDKALSKMAQAVELLAKDGPPAAHDGFSLPAKKAENPSPKDKEIQNNKSSGACEEHGVVGCKECISKAEDDPPEEDKKAKKKAKKEAKKLAKKENRKKRLEKAKELVTSLDKRMSVAGSLSYSFDSIRDAQRSLMLEAEREKGDKKDAALAKELGQVAHQLGGVIAQKAQHEAEESLDLSDCDDEFIRNLLENSEMDKLAVSNGDVSDLDTAVLNILKRSMEPSKEKRMTIARGNLKKARQARKDAEEEVKNCHTAISKSYMAKLAKAKKDKPDDDEDEMAETEKVLKGLQKAYSALMTMKTFIKAADSHLEKAASRSGQRGQEVNDPAGDTPVNKPTGLKDLSPGEMASAGGGGQPPMYPTDGGVYPGKMSKFVDKNGMVPAAVAELMAENAQLAGQASLLSRVSSPSNSRPYAFDMSKVYGVDPGRPDDRRRTDILFEGVDPTALQSQDENVRNKAAATVAGNYLLNSSFGKSIVDSGFRGKAGMGRSNT
jgi:hypothetical protein